MSTERQRSDNEAIKRLMGIAKETGVGEEEARQRTTSDAWGPGAGSDPISALTHSASLFADAVSIRSKPPAIFVLRLGRGPLYLRPIAPRNGLPGTARGC